MDVKIPFRVKFKKEQVLFLIKMLNKQVNRYSKESWSGCYKPDNRENTNMSLYKNAGIIKNMMKNTGPSKKNGVTTCRKIFRKDKNIDIQLKDTSFKLRPDKKVVKEGNVDMTVYEIHRKKMKEIEDRKKTMNRLEKQLKKEKYTSRDTAELEQEIDNIKTKIDEEELDYYYKTKDILISYFTDDLDLNNPNRKSKRSLFKDYNNAIDCIDLYVKKGKDYSMDYICEECGGEELVNDAQKGDIICVDCGLVRLNDLDPENPNSYPYNITLSSVGTKCIKTEENDKGGPYSYKKVNHFKDHISHIQAEEKTDVPQKVIDVVKLEMKKNRINETDLNGKITREFLKKHGLNRFYDCIYKIISVIQGKPPVKMEPELKDQLCDMFNEIQEPYIKHCPDNRSSFLNYRFVLHKFCQLIDRDEYLDYFPLLKPGEKLKEQDNIWKNICRDLEWQFIPSE